jgi:DNA mismatch repair protein PMS2
MVAEHSSESNSLIPSVRSEMANKACRRAVKIGDPINREKMTQIINNLSELEAPWNCPHGRPTMVVTNPIKYTPETGSYSSLSQDQY